MPIDIQTWISSAQAALISSQNPDGGWPYRTGDPAGTEPTALGALALRFTSSGAEVVAAAEDWLLNRRRDDGYFAASVAAPQGSWVTPMAALALSTSGSAAAQSAVTAAAESVLNEPVYVLKPNQFLPGQYGYDPTLPGWPWTISDFSFVEPAAMAVLFLKRAGRGDEDRVRQGVAFLRDRALHDGGWNYGEPIVLGTGMYPTIVPTALALLALADEPDATTAAGLDWLRSQRGLISSPFSLGWACCALNVLGALDDNWRQDIVTLWAGAIPERREAMDTALALLGVAAGADHPFALT